MKLFANLKLATQQLSRFEECWAVCGGIAACLYRSTPRYTGDIDFILRDSNDFTALQIAETVTAALGYKPIAGWFTDQSGQLIKNQALVSGREDSAERYIGLDFILPVMPWVIPAIERAQLNKLDYGFAKLPTIVPEDLIVAKLFALQTSPDRKYDLDDIESILAHFKPINFTLIRTQVDQYNLNVPQHIQKLIS